MNGIRLEKCFLIDADTQVGTSRESQPNAGPQEQYPHPPRKERGSDEKQSQGQKQFARCIYFKKPYERACGRMPKDTFRCHQYGKERKDGTNADHFRKRRKNHQD